MPRADLVRVRLLSCPESVPLARHLLARALRPAWDQPVIDAAVLCLSELVTNAVQAIAATPQGEQTTAEQDVTVVASWDEEPPRLRIEVTDPAPGSPAAPRDGPGTDLAEHGRGLELIALLAAAWGVEPAAETKTVWCELSPHQTTTHEESPHRNGHSGNRTHLTEEVPV